MKVVDSSGWLEYFSARAASWLIYVMSHLADRNAVGKAACGTDACDYPYANKTDRLML